MGVELSSQGREEEAEDAFWIVCLEELRKRRKEGEVGTLVRVRAECFVEKVR